MLDKEKPSKAQAVIPTLTSVTFPVPKRLSIRALFHTASKVIQQAHASLPNAAEDFPLHRVGPQVIRNTAIVAWLRAGMNETELTRFIGVDGPRALLHLRYQWPVLAEAVPPPPAAATE